MKQKTISIHSSRGGTGKTLIASNLAAIYANRGLNVALLDLDFHAPSLYAVFSKYTKNSHVCSLNDYFDNRCTAKQAMLDSTETIGLKGRLLVGFADPSVDAIRNMLQKSRAWEVTAVKRLFSLLSTLFHDMEIDCCIFDTSPGIHYTSVNAVVSSDISVIVATPDLIDLKGVETMLKELFNALSKKTAVVINKIFPETVNCQTSKQKELVSYMQQNLKHLIIGSIPCYCEVLQADRSSLLVINKPNHPFSKNLEEIANKIEQSIQ